MDIHKSVPKGFTTYTIDDLGMRMFSSHLALYYALTAASEDYPRCLREWARYVSETVLSFSGVSPCSYFRRLDENWTPELIQSLQERHPALKDVQNLEAFKRRWLYMCQYMEVAYSRVWLSLKCWTMTRPVRIRIQVSAFADVKERGVDVLLYDARVKLNNRLPRRSRYLAL